VLGERGLNLLLIDRSAELLEQGARELRARHRVAVEALTLDLGALDLEAHVLAALGERDVGLLVYNAGHSQVGAFLSVDLTSKLQTLDVNCRGPLVLSSLLAQRLVQRGRGGILLMSSLSGFQGTAMVSTYAASKAFNTILGESLWAELGPRGVDVLVCAAGATSTPTFDAQTALEKRKHAFPMQPEEVARGAIDHLRKGPVYIPGAVNRLAALLGRVLGRKRAVELFSKGTRRMYP
jgi:short-subunit dehydrogenase